MSEKNILENAQDQLMALAIAWLARWSGQDPGALLKYLPGADGKKLEPYQQLLGPSQAATEPGSALESIFSRIQDPQGGAEPTPHYWQPQELSLEKVPVPAQEATVPESTLAGWWRDFEREAQEMLGRTASAGARFEMFTHLLHKWAWAVPCSYGERGVSAYDEFRALSALVHASGCGQEPASQFLLVAGDIPGIQSFVYTITSKGAAKGLRGRSFFIQLLGDAVVRRILAELGLPETNVIYTAGGNFMLLAQAGAEGTVAALADEINRALLDAFEGDLALCLACQELPAADVGTHAFSSDASREVREEIGRQKQRRFADIAAQDWKAVFGAEGQGGVRFCAVCQHELAPGEKGQSLADGGLKCAQCYGFEELAQAIAAPTLLMFVRREPPGTATSGWQGLLARLTGMRYDFSAGLQENLPPDAQIYSVNELDFLGEYAHGFRLIANTTPRDDQNQVKTFEELADGAQGWKKVGVLRMDVDDLGRVLTQWLPGRTLASTSALSHALDRFFTGWLDALCQEAMAKPGMKGVPDRRGDLLYVIYAGGDDLFVVGAWDLMPLLAEWIQKRFSAYVGGNPFLHISAGVTVEDRKFPLYQAADQAGAALDQAKAQATREVNGLEMAKSAISLLGVTMGWEPDGYPFAKSLAEKLIGLTQEKGVPHSLLTTLRAIHNRYLMDVKEARERGQTGEKVHYGPWMWRKVYQLSRVRQRHTDQEVKDAIQDLEEKVLVRENMVYVGLATRWAEYLTRGGSK